MLDKIRGLFAEQPKTRPEPMTEAQFLQSIEAPPWLNIPTTTVETRERYEANRAATENAQIATIENNRRLYEEARAVKAFED